MKYIKYNPNPLNKNTGDCVVRAISVALNISWDESFRMLCDIGFIMKDMPSSNSVWDRLLLCSGFKRELIRDSFDYSIKDFCRQYDEGVFVIGTGSHAVAVIDGNYYDAWDSGNEIPTYFYRKVKV